MNGGHVAELATAFANLARATQVDALGLEQGFIESGEIEALASIFLTRHIAAGTDDIRLTDVTKLFDLGQKFRTNKHCV